MRLRLRWPQIAWPQPLSKPPLALVCDSIDGLPGSMSLIKIGEQYSDLFCVFSLKCVV